MARVVTSDAAVQLISRLQLDVEGVREALEAMLRTGNELAMPDVWEGTAANRFRDSEWADTQRWAMSSVQQLVDLRAAVDQVNQSIQEAGGGLG